MGIFGSEAFCISGKVKPFGDLSLALFADDFRGSPGETVRIHGRNIEDNEVSAECALEMLDCIEGKVMELYSRKMSEDLTYIANFKRLLRKSLEPVETKETVTK